MLPAKTTIPICLMLALVFVGFGDQFLPQPLSGASFKTRVAINQWMTGSFHIWQPKTNPYARTERALDQTGKGGTP